MEMHDAIIIVTMAVEYVAEETSLCWWM